MLIGVYTQNISNGKIYPDIRHKLDIIYSLCAINNANVSEIEKVQNRMVETACDRKLGNELLRQITQNYAALIIGGSWEKHSRQYWNGRNKKNESC